MLMGLIFLIAERILPATGLIPNFPRRIPKILSYRAKLKALHI